VEASVREVDFRHTRTADITVTVESFAHSWQPVNELTEFGAQLLPKLFAADSSLSSVRLTLADVEAPEVAVEYNRRDFTSGEWVSMAAYAADWRYSIDQDGWVPFFRLASHYVFHNRTHWAEVTYREPLPSGETPAVIELPVTK